MKRVHLFAILLLSVAAVARADSQTQAVQQALKDQGFYYGQVDGQPGPETDAAIRRYQIRQGLDVTGKMDEQTLDSLNLSGNEKDKNTLQAVRPPADDSADSQAAPQETPAQNSTAQSDRDFLRRHPPATPAPVPEEDAAPQPPEPPQQPEPPEQAEAGQTLPADYARFFRKTPYETAPPVVQRSTVQRAQLSLAREGFYRGMADGELGDALSRALVAYQRDAEISPSGRLDMDTLSDMNLLPKRHVMIRPPAPYDYYGGPPDGRGVYRGIWVH